MRELFRKYASITHYRDIRCMDNGEISPYTWTPSRGSREPHRDCGRPRIYDSNRPRIHRCRAGSPVLPETPHTQCNQLDLAGHPLGASLVATGSRAPIKGVVNGGLGYRPGCESHRSVSRIGTCRAPNGGMPSTRLPRDQLIRTQTLGARALSQPPCNPNHIGR